MGISKSKSGAIKPVKIETMQAAAKKPASAKSISSASKASPSKPKTSQTAPKVSPSKPRTSQTTIKVLPSKINASQETPIKDLLPFPLLEYDATSKPVVQAIDFSDARRRVSRCLITYFGDIVAKYDAAEKLSLAFQIRTEGLRPQVYEMKVGGEYIYVMLNAGGAPNAAKAIECMSAMGVKRFMVCSGAGTLDDKITGDKVLIPTSAVRDEGTSFHYLPPSREIPINKRVQKSIESALARAGAKWASVKTWTTDAPYRETLNKVNSRRIEGCSTVEMECAAYYAAAEHKNVLCGQIMFAGDIQKKDGWDYFIWHAATDLREKLFDLAAKCLMEL